MAFSFAAMGAEGNSVRSAEWPFTTASRVISRFGCSRRRSYVNRWRIARSIDIRTLGAEGLASVRAPNLAGAPARGVRRQVQDEVGLILRLAEHPQRRLLLHAIDERVVLRLVDLAVRALQVS